MAPLPDPTDRLDAGDKALFDRMASVRARAERRAPLPDDVRELAILRYAVRQGSGYEWSHHERPAEVAGVSAETIAELSAGDIPTTLPDTSRAALRAVDAVVARDSIPAAVQDQIVAAYGEAGVVELVLLCGLYAIMGYMVSAFDIPIEEGLPTPPDSLRGPVRRSL